MTGCSAAAQHALACWGCLCITWSSLIGLGLPLLVTLIYLPRVLRELTLDDLTILIFATVFTYASKTVTHIGVAHTPMMVIIVCFWTIFACLTDRVASLRSLPMIWFLCFVSVLIPDLVTTSQHTPEGMIGIPGGRGLIDGLILKPLVGVVLMSLAYVQKVHPLWVKKELRNMQYDRTSRDFLLNLSPTYRKPEQLEARLVLEPKPQTFNSRAVL